MGIALFKERRLSSRRKLTGLLPGKLTVASLKAPLVCRLTDVSAHGLGIVANVEISLGARAVLETGTLSIEFEVIWAAPDFGKQDMFRYGLVSTDHEVNIEQIFIDCGCLK